MKKSKQEINDEQVERLQLIVQKILASDTYERDYAEFEKKQDTLSPSELEAEQLRFYQKYSFLPVHPAFIKAIAKRGDQLNWSYEPWRYLLMQRPFSPVHLDETIEQDEQGNPVHLYVQDERGYIRFFIKPDAKRKLIHAVLNNILDSLQKEESTEQIKSVRHRKEKLGALAVWNKVKKGKSIEQAARELNITKDTAKKRYDSIKRLLPEEAGDTVEKKCIDCEKYDTCKKPCPEKERYVEQDNRGYQREFPVGLEPMQLIKKRKLSKKTYD